MHKKQILYSVMLCAFPFKSAPGTTNASLHFLKILIRIRNMNSLNCSKDLIWPVACI